MTSRGWVDPVPDPLLLRKSGNAGDRTRDLRICSQKLWPPDHRGGRLNIKPNETMQEKCVWGKVRSWVFPFLGGDKARAYVWTQVIIFPRSYRSCSNTNYSVRWDFPVPGSGRRPRSHFWTLAVMVWEVADLGCLFFGLPISDSPRWPRRGCMGGGERVAGDRCPGGSGWCEQYSAKQYRAVAALSGKQARPLTSSCLFRCWKAAL